jgi:hypothetical protein
MEYFLIDIIRYYIEDAQLGVYGNTDIVWQDSRPQPPEEQIEQWKLSYPNDIAKDNCKSKAQTLLNESDFADLYSVRNKLQNINEWDSYREIIRNLRTNPVEKPVFPDKPKTIWKES